MKNSADLGGCYLPRLLTSVDNTLLGLQNSLYPTQPHSIIANYYSFKIFLRFWLVKTTCKIHHNQLLFTKFGKNLRHMDSMTSKVEPSENYWPLTSKWRQKCSLLQIIEPLTAKTWGQGCVIFGERENKERNSETPLRRRKYFEWIIKQLLNSAFVGYEEFCRSRRLLSTSAFGLCG